MMMAVILNFMMNLLFEFCEFAAAGHRPLLNSMVSIKLIAMARGTESDSQNHA